MNTGDICDMTIETLEKYQSIAKNIEAIRTAIESLIMQKRLAEYRDFDICEWQENYDWEENNISEYQSVASVNDFLIDELKGEDDED